MLGERRRHHGVREELEVLLLPVGALLTMLALILIAGGHPI